MSYQSFGFLLFSCVCVALYYLVGRKGQRFVLAAANLTFFLVAGAEYVPFVITTILATYFGGRVIGRIYETADRQIAECTEQSQKKQLRQAAKSKAKKALLAVLTVTVGLLAVCKYASFAVENVNLALQALGIPQITTFRMILPIGISFYTFMAIGYVLDIYWKRYQAEKSLIDYAVFVSYFPHVVQGPIDRYNEFKAQIENGVALRYKNITYGAQLAVWGFFKKLVIADRLGVLVDTVLGDWKSYDGMFLILAFVVYSVQIYADFSGCIDIVSGVSEMLGIKLRKNFHHPYFSKTMGEFWRRWHMSLQEWFKDYIYYPVSVSRPVKAGKKKLKGCGKKRAEELFASCVPVLVVWLITGIWHGAAWKFVIWGLFHAALLIGSQVFAPLFAKLNAIFNVNTDNFGWHLWQMLRTFALCCVGRIFFRADSVTAAFQMIQRMLVSTNVGVVFRSGIKLGLDADNLCFAVISVIVLWVVDMLQERMPLRETLARQNIIFRWIILYAAILVILIFGVYGPEYDASTFIYEQF